MELTFCAAYVFHKSIHILPDFETNRLAFQVCVEHNLRQANAPVLPITRGALLDSNVADANMEHGLLKLSDQHKQLLGPK
jgi:hypothetical protein